MGERESRGGRTVCRVFVGYFVGPYVGTMSGLCRDYVGTMSGLCRYFVGPYVGIASGLCRYCVGTMSDRMSGITGCMSDMVSLELGLESGCLDLSPAFTTDDRFRPDFRQPTRQPMGGGGGGW